MSKGKTDHLKGFQFKPGESGNPSGRRKGSIELVGRIRQVLERKTPDGKTYADALAEVLVREAIRNPAKMWSFLKEFLDRDEGRTDRRDLDEMGVGAEQLAVGIRAAVIAMQESVPKPGAPDAK